MNICGNCHYYYGNDETCYCSVADCVKFAATKACPYGRAR